MAELGVKRMRATNRSKTMRCWRALAVYLIVLVGPVSFTVAAGAFEAIQVTRHAVLDRISAERTRAAHGWHYAIRVSRADRVILRTLLAQVGSGAWPGVTAYGRKACRRALQRR